MGNGVSGTMRAARLTVATPSAPSSMSAPSPVWLSARPPSRANPSAVWQNWPLAGEQSVPHWDARQLV